jgi:hypothetical protein
MMRKVRETTIAATLAWMLSSMAMASPPNMGDEQIVDSMQTAQPIPNTPVYDTWAHWIREQIARDAANYHDFQNGQFVPKTISQDVDLITIKTTFGAADVGKVQPGHADVPSGNSQISLPVDGTPGEHITIVSQTAMTYLSWTYVWKKDADSGRGGWALTANAFHDCQYGSNRSAVARCDKPIDPAVGRNNPVSKVR